MDFYNKIDFLCKEKGLSRRKMCEEINLSYNTFNSMLRRKSTNITLDVIEDIANFLNVTCDYLIKDNITDVNYGKQKEETSEGKLKKDKNQKTERKSLKEILAEEDQKHYAKIAGYGGGVKTIEINKKQEQEKKYYALIKDDEEGYKRIDMTKDEFSKINGILDIMRK